MHKLEFLSENETDKILRNIVIQTDQKTRPSFKKQKEKKFILRILPFQRTTE